MSDMTTLTPQLRRADRAMPEDEALEMLASTFCGRTGTLGPDGYPYVVPNLYVWLDGQIYLHTARYAGHFATNVRHHPQVSFEIDEPGSVYPTGPVECDTSVAYRSVIVFGAIRIVEDDAEKRRFYQAFMTKYAPPDSWGRPKDSLPRINATIVYAINPVRITGKRNVLPQLDARWHAPQTGA